MKVRKAVSWILCALAITILVFLGIQAGGIEFGEEDTLDQVTEPEEIAQPEPVSKPYEGKTILIDPGHGGFDPGKVGVNGEKEKDINLQIALLLKGKLETEGVIVQITRSDDKGLYDEGNNNKKVQDLKRRLALIEETNADLSVSIHQNSYRDASVCGPQVFYYSTSKMGESAAGFIQERLNTNLEVARPRVIKGNESYYLLKKTSVPLIIAECGFLSNATEAQLLSTKEYQEKVAQAIKEGIYDYLGWLEEQE